ncbi:MAG: dihydropteroate synthase [Prevotellaceae bacterium]|jgi:dihydropteroate synthase|nr:dihydropteroate synthase [Prevotellaceae bacterium]
MQLKIGNKSHFFHTPQVMGVVNITPDSFYATSRHQSINDVFTTVSAMIEEGAAIIDLGAASSRPGAHVTSALEEWNRLAPVVGSFRQHFADVIVSVDTFYSDVVERVFDAIGPFIVNDISAGEEDPRMFAVVSRLQLPMVAMCKREIAGIDVVKELHEFFAEVIDRAQDAGVQQIILDPGFGFAKSIKQNYLLLSALPQIFDFHDVARMIGISRKSMIYKPLNITPDDALPATSALHLFALQQGVDVLRVHDVATAKQIIQIYLNFL